MIDPRLPDSLREDLRRQPVDWGNAYAGPAGHATVRVFPEAAATATSSPVLDPAGEVALTSALEPMRSMPSHQSEQISQVRSGEWLTLLLEEGEWGLVAGEDDYVGWVRSWVLRRTTGGEREEQRSRRLGRYARPADTLWASDHWASSPLWRGLPLLAPSEGERRRASSVLVEVPHGATGWLAENDVEAMPTTASLGVALDAARSLLGTPYAWGGRSPGGLDCSAFVQLALQMGGFALPRDARQQVLAGEPVPGDVAVWQAGDLLFFGDPPDHVGLFDGRGGLLHCSAFARRQKVGDIPQLMGRLSHVRRLGHREWVTRSTLWQCPVTASGSSS